MAEHLSSIDLHASLANHFCLPYFPVKRYKSLPPPPSVPLSFKVILTLLRFLRSPCHLFCTLLHFALFTKPLPSVLYTSALCMFPQCLLFSWTWDTASSAGEGTVQPHCHLLRAWGPLVPSKLFRKSHTKTLLRNKTT